MAKEEKKQRRGVGDAAAEAILAGMDNEEALEQVKEEFPEKNTSIASINWYRNKLRAGGHDVMTARELRKARKNDPLD